MCDNVLLREVRVFGPEGDEIAADWRKFHNGDLKLRTSTNVTRITQGKIAKCIQVSGGKKLMERDHCVEVGIDGRIIL